jgi:hypothetical protein
LPRRSARRAIGATIGRCASAGGEMADQINGADFVEHDGSDHSSRYSKP